jgi:type VI secretion system protein ImpM
MQCGLFGKLQTKRDFVTVDLPRNVVTAWEEWIQKALARSQESLGDDWLATYLSAPLWRFRIGREIAGCEIAGVMMPSVDGVGRKFPLMVACCAEDDETFDQPESARSEAWYAAVEDYLLNLLDAEPTYEEAIEALRNLPSYPSAAPAQDIPVNAADWGYAAACDAASLPAALARLRELEQARLLQKTSLWWTIGGADWTAAAFICSGMPSEVAFTAMLSGGFAEPTCESN